MNPYTKINQGTKRSFAAYYHGSILKSWWFWLLTISFAATLRFLVSSFMARWSSIDHIGATAVVVLVIVVWLHLVIQHRRIRKAMLQSQEPKPTSLLQEVAWSSFVFSLALLMAVSFAIRTLIR